MKKNFYRYHHLGIPTTVPVNGEVYLKDYKLFHAGYEQSEFGIEWMRYGEGCDLPEIVKTLPHVAFEVDDIYEALRGRKVIIAPNSPSEGHLSPSSKRTARRWSLYRLGILNLSSR